MDLEKLVTQVDENDNVIGLQPKSKFNDGKLIHRSSYLLLLNSKGELLLQKRALSKKWHPGKWTFPVAGTVGDETYEDCIRREIREAFGKVMNFKTLFKYRHFDKVDKAFKMVFLAKAEANEITFNKNYSANHAWIAINELEEEINNSEKYAPPFIAGMKIVFKKNLLKHP